MKEVIHMYSLKKLQEDKQAEFYDVPYYYPSYYTDNIRILGIYHDIDDKVIISRDGIVTMSLLRYDLGDNYYFVSRGRKYYIDNMMRIDGRL